MSTTARNETSRDQSQAAGLRPEALEAVATIHEAIRSWLPESEYVLTDNGAEFPVLFGRCSLSVNALDIDTWDGFRLSEQIEARTELSYVLDDFPDGFFRLANTYATTGATLRCPVTGNAVLVSGVRVFRDDAEALRTLYVPAVLWSSVVQSYSIKEALHAYLGDDFLGEKSGQIGIPHYDEPSRWGPDDFAMAEAMLGHNGIFCNASETALTAEFPWEPDAVTSITGGRTSLIELNSAVCHPAAGRGLAFRMRLPISADTGELEQMADTLNELEVTGVDLPPGFGAWMVVPQTGSLGYAGFWPNCMYRSGTVANIASWCKIRSTTARQVIGNQVSAGQVYEASRRG
jgi:hypothetical protein